MDKKDSNSSIEKVEEFSNDERSISSVSETEVKPKIMFEKDISNAIFLKNEIERMRSNSGTFSIDSNEITPRVHSLIDEAYKTLQYSAPSSDMLFEVSEYKFEKNHRK